MALMQCRWWRVGGPVCLICSIVLATAVVGICGKILVVQLQEDGEGGELCYWEGERVEGIHFV